MAPFQTLKRITPFTISICESCQPVLIAVWPISERITPLAFVGFTHINIDVVAEFACPTNFEFREVFVIIY